MFDYIATFCKIVSSQVSGAKKSILFALQGPGTGLANDTPETSPSEPSWGQIGILARPLPQNPNGSAESLALRLPDALVPTVGRDLRLNNAVDALEPGQFMMAHYGGGFITVKGVDVTNTQTLIQLKTLNNTLTMDPTGLGSINLNSNGVSIGNSNTAQSVAYYATLSSYVTALKAYLLLVNPVVIAAVGGPLTPGGVLLTTAYGVLQTAETAILASATASTQILKSN